MIIFSLVYPLPRSAGYGAATITQEGEHYGVYHSLHAKKPSSSLPNYGFGDDNYLRHTLCTLKGAIETMALILMRSCPWFAFSSLPEVRESVRKRLSKEAS